jgi:carbon monoxide dehydrogenase subunit G
MVLGSNLKGDDWVAKVTKSIEIEASPEKVFAFIIDREKMNEAGKGFVAISCYPTEGEYTSKGPVGVGSTLHFARKAGGSQIAWDYEITEFVNNKKVAMRTIGASKFKIVGSWTLEPTAKGTKLLYSMDYEPPYSVLGKVVDKLKSSKDIEKSMEKQLGNIKKALET